MKIGVIKERCHNEKRVALSPQVAKSFVQKGFSVFVESGLAKHIGFDDKDYIDSGAKVSKVPLEILGDADIILKVQHTQYDQGISEFSLAKNGAVVIGFLEPNTPSPEQYNKKIIRIALELMPRITKAQDMDALSSQYNLAGYRAVIESAYFYQSPFPMLTTSAGNIMPAKFCVIGAGVAGLQAIATAKRMGAIVSAYDIRPEAKEQIASTGGRVVQDQDGLVRCLKQSDVVICTVSSLKGRSPIIITKEIMDQMKAGSLIMDIAARSGGNTYITEADKVTYSDNNVRVMGYSNILSNIALDASKFYANNLLNLVNKIVQNNKIFLDDEVISPMVIK